MLAHRDALPTSVRSPEVRAQVALRLYQWPPSYAFLRACMLDAYAAAGCDLRPPIIDLGCGDGRFAMALSECGLAEEPAAVLDRDSDLLREAPPMISMRCVAGDLLALPFERECAGTVICNTALNCFVGGRLDQLDAALREARQLLRLDGRFWCCVHTRALADLHLGYRLLTSLGLRRSAARYLDAIHQSNGRTIHLSAEQWARRLSDAGFTVERTIHFFTSQESTMRRKLRLLRYLPPRSFALRVRDWLILHHRLRVGEQAKLGPAGAAAPATGYVLIVARKAVASEPGQTNAKQGSEGR
jgi:ubiquinone/menaquinone biosynthesis C-methylase UbiE